MKLTEYQLTTALHAVAFHRDPDLENRDFGYQAQLKTDTMDWIMPMLQLLPDGTRAAQLLDFDDHVKREALELLIKRLRRTQIYRDEPAAAIVAGVSREQLFLFAQQIFLFTTVALETLEALAEAEAVAAQNDLEDVLKAFDKIDLDEEMARLLDGER